MVTGSSKAWLGGFGELCPFGLVSDGKALVANAITDKGVTTSSTATFATMANNINALSNISSFFKNVTINNNFNLNTFFSDESVGGVFLYNTTVWAIILVHERAGIAYHYSYNSGARTFKPSGNTFRFPGNTRAGSNDYCTINFANKTIEWPTENSLNRVMMMKV